MKYKRFADTQIMLSVLAAGNTSPAAGIAKSPERMEDAARAIRAMVENGVNLIDTASSYAGGESELVVGKALETLDRSKLFITTKYGMGSVYADGKRSIVARLDAQSCVRECEQSLRRMGLDYIDLFMPHIPSQEVDLESLAESLSKLQRDGKIRFVGLSNFSRDKIERFNQMLKVSMLEMPYSLIDRGFEDTLIWARAHQISTMTYGALADGIFNGVYAAAPDLSDPEDTRAGYQFFYEPYFSKAMAVYAKLREIGERRGAASGEVAINWTRVSPAVSSVILGTGREKHARANCRALDWELAPEEIDEINACLDQNVGRGINNKRFFRN